MSADPASTVVTPVLTVTSLRRRHTVAAPSGNAAGSVDAGDGAVSSPAATHAIGPPELTTTALRPDSRREVTRPSASATRSRNCENVSG